MQIGDLHNIGLHGLTILFFGSRKNSGAELNFGLVDRYITGYGLVHCGTFTGKKSDHERPKLVSPMAAASLLCSSGGRVTPSNSLRTCPCT